MTTEQREALADCQFLMEQRGFPRHADAIRAALAEIDRQGEELALLRPLVPTVSYDDCQCPHCDVAREWRRRFGGKAE